MRRIPELDALRGVAALAIVIFHLWLERFGAIGTAVDLFFVLSGYLITTIILRGLDAPRFLPTFFVRRSLRIWPIYYLSLLGLVALSRVLPHPLRLDALAEYVAYLPNLEHYWFAPETPFTKAFMHTWTLAIEEQFYLVWPLALMVTGRRGVAPLAVGLIALSITARLAGFSPWILIAHADGLALGGLLAALLARFEGRELPRRGLTVGFGLLGLASVVYLAVDARLLGWLGGGWGPIGRPATVRAFRALGVSLMYLAVVAVVVLQAGRGWLAPLRDRRLVYLGQISYGIYLYHYIVHVLLDEYGAGMGLTAGPGRDAVKLALTFGLASASWRFVERPLLGLKDRFGYRRGPATARPGFGLMVASTRLTTTKGA